MKAAVQTHRQPPGVSVPITLPTVQGAYVPFNLHEERCAGIPMKKDLFELTNVTRNLLDANEMIDLAQGNPDCAIVIQVRPSIDCADKSSNRPT